MGYRRHTEKEINDFALEVVNGVEENEKKQEEKARLLKKIEDREKAEKAASVSSSSAEPFSLSPSIKNDMFDSTVEKFASPATLEKVGDAMQTTTSKPKSSSDILALGRGPINYEGAVKVNSVDDILRNDLNSASAYGNIGKYENRDLGVGNKGYLSTRRSLGKIEGQAKAASDYLTANKESSIKRLSELGDEKPEETYNSLLTFYNDTAKNTSTYGEAIGDKDISGYYRYIATGNSAYKGDYDKVVSAAERYKTEKNPNLKKYSEAVKDSVSLMKVYAMGEVDKYVESGANGETLLLWAEDLRKRAAETTDKTTRKALNERASTIEEYTLSKGLLGSESQAKLRSKRERVMAENEDAARLLTSVNAIIDAANGIENVRNSESPYSLQYYATTTRGKAVVKYLEDNGFSNESLKVASEILTDYKNEYDRANYFLNVSQKEYYDAKWKEFEEENSQNGVAEYEASYREMQKAKSDMGGSSEYIKPYAEASERYAKASVPHREAKKKLESAVGKEAAEEYYEYVAWKLSQEEGKAFEEETKKRIDRYMGKSEDGDNIGGFLGGAGVVGENIATFATNLVGIAYTPIHWIAEGLAKDSDKPFDEYGNPMMTYTNAVRGETGENIENDLARKVYEGVMSSVDSVAMAYLGGAVGKALGAAGASAGAASTASKIATGVTFGISSAENMAIDVTSRGGAREPALASGVVAGIAETLFESWSIGKFNILKKSGLGGFKNFASDHGKGVAVNFSEEGNTEFANGVADILINGGASQYAENVRIGYFSGMSLEDAKREASKQFAWQVLDAAEGGAMQGFLMGSVGGAKSSLRRYVIGSQIRHSNVTQDGLNSKIRHLLDDATYLPAGSKEAEYVRSLSEKYYTQGKLSDSEIGSISEITSNFFAENEGLYREAHAEEYAFSDEYDNAGKKKRRRLEKQVMDEALGMPEGTEARGLAERIKEENGTGELGRGVTMNLYSALLDARKETEAIKRIDGASNAVVYSDGEKALIEQGVKPELARKGVTILTKLENGERLSSNEIDILRSDNVLYGKTAEVIGLHAERTSMTAKGFREAVRGYSDSRQAEIAAEVAKASAENEEMAARYEAEARAIESEIQAAKAEARSENTAVETRSGNAEASVAVSDTRADGDAVASEKASPVSDRTVEARAVSEAGGERASAVSDGAKFAEPSENVSVALGKANTSAVDTVNTDVASTGKPVTVKGGEAKRYASPSESVSEALAVGGSAQQKNVKTEQNVAQEEQNVAQEERKGDISENADAEQDSYAEPVGSVSEAMGTNEGDEVDIDIEGESEGESKKPAEVVVKKKSSIWSPIARFFRSGTTAVDIDSDGIERKTGINDSPTFLITGEDRDVIREEAKSLGVRVSYMDDSTAYTSGKNVKGSASASGRDVRIFLDNIRREVKARAEANGEVLSEKELNARIASEAVRVTYHEFGHIMEVYAKEAFADFKALAKERYIKKHGEDGFNRAWEELNKNEGRELSEEEVESELACDMIPELLEDKKFLSLFEKQMNRDRTAFGRFLNALGELLSRVRSFFESLGFTKRTDDEVALRNLYIGLRQSFNRASAEYRRQERQGTVAGTIIVDEKTGEVLRRNEEKKNGEPRFSIHSMGKDSDGQELYRVYVSEDITRGENPVDTPSKIKRYILDNFDEVWNEIPGSAKLSTKVDKTGANEFAYSEYTKRLKGKERYDKWRMAANLDEIIQARRNVEVDTRKYHHSKNSNNYITFSHADVEIQVKNNLYSGRLVTGITSEGKEYFYDVVGLKRIDMGKQKSSRPQPSLDNKVIFKRETGWQSATVDSISETAEKNNKQNENKPQTIVNGGEKRSTVDTRKLGEELDGEKGKTLEDLRKEYEGKEIFDGKDTYRITYSEKYNAFLMPTVKSDGTLEWFGAEIVPSEKLEKFVKWAEMRKQDAEKRKEQKRLEAGKEALLKEKQAEKEKYLTSFLSSKSPMQAGKMRNALTKYFTDGLNTHEFIEKAVRDGKEFGVREKNGKNSYRLYVGKNEFYPITKTAYDYGKFLESSEEFKSTGEASAVENTSVNAVETSEEVVKQPEDVAETDEGVIEAPEETDEAEEAGKEESAVADGVIDDGVTDDGEGLNADGMGDAEGGDEVGERERILPEYNSRGQKVSKFAETVADVGMRLNEAGRTEEGTDMVEAAKRIAENPVEYKTEPMSHEVTAKAAERAREKDSDGTEGKTAIIKAIERFNNVLGNKERVDVLSTEDTYNVLYYAEEAKKLGLIDERDELFAIAAENFNRSGRIVELAKLLSEMSGAAYEKYMKRKEENINRTRRGKIVTGAKQKLFDEAVKLGNEKREREGELEKVKAKLARISEKYRKAQAEIARLEAERNSEYSEALFEAEEKLKALGDELVKAKEEAKKAKEAAAKAQHELKAARKELDKMPIVDGEEYGGADSENGEARKKLAEVRGLKKRIRNLEGMIAGKADGDEKKAELEKRVETLKETLKQKEDELRAVGRSPEEVKAIEKLLNKVARLENKVKKLTEAYELSDEEKAKKVQRISELEAEIQSIYNGDGERMGLTELRKQLASAKGKEKRRGERIDRLTKELAEKEAQIEEIARKYPEYEKLIEEEKKLQSRVKYLQKQIDRFADESGKPVDIQAEIDRLNAEIEEKKAEKRAIAEKNPELAKLFEAERRLKSEIREIENYKSGRAQENAKKRIDKLNEKLEKLNREYASFAEDKEKVRKEVEEAKKKVSERFSDLAILKSINKKLGANAPVFIEANLIEQYRNAENPDERQKIAQTIVNELISEIPHASFLERLTAWKHVCLLGSIKTPERNLYSNTVNYILTGVNDRIATVIETMYYKISGNKDFERTKASAWSKLMYSEGVDKYSRALAKKGKRWLGEIKHPIRTAKGLLGNNLHSEAERESKFRSEVLEFLEKDADMMQGVLQGKEIGDGKGDDIVNMFNEQRRIFKWGYHEKLRKAVNASLETPDLWFLRSAYKSSLLSALAARKIDISELSSKDEKARSAAETALASARDYAVRRAKEVTFREQNWLADQINGLKKNPIGKLILEPMITYVKTPANVAKQSFLNSPISFIAAVYNVLSAKGKKGNIMRAEKTGNEAEAIEARAKYQTAVEKAIEDTAKGFTGTALCFAGYMLSKGIEIMGAKISLRFGGGDDDDYEDLLGYQDLSFNLEFGDSKYSISLSQFSPTVVPLLIGSLFREKMSEDDKEVSDNTLGALWGASSKFAMAFLKVLVDTTMLSNVDDFISDVNSAQGYTKNDDGLNIMDAGLTLALGYLQQFLVPTYISHLTKAIAGSGMRSYKDKERDELDFFRGVQKRFINKIGGLGSVVAEVADYTGWEVAERLATFKYVDEWGRTSGNDSIIGGVASIVSGKYSDGAMEILRAIGIEVLMPFFASEVIETEADKEILRLREALGTSVYVEGENSYGIYPETAKKTVDFLGGSVRFSAREYEQFATVKGKTQRELIEAAVGREDYQKLSDGEKAKIIDKIYNLAEKIAAKEVIGDKYASGDNVYNTAVGRDIGGMLDILLYENALSEYKADTGDIPSEKEKTGILLGLGYDSESAVGIWRGMVYTGDEKLGKLADKLAPSEAVDVMKYYNKIGKEGAESETEKANALLEMGLSDKVTEGIWKAHIGSETRVELYDMLKSEGLIRNATEGVKLFAEYPGDGYDISLKLKDEGREAVITEILGEKASVIMDDKGTFTAEKYNSMYKADLKKRLGNIVQKYKIVKDGEYLRNLADALEGEVQGAKEDVESAMMDDYIANGGKITISTSTGVERELSATMSAYYWKGIKEGNDSYKPSAALATYDKNGCVKYGGVVYRNLRKGLFDTKRYADYYVQYYTDYFNDNSDRLGRFAKGSPAAEKLLSGIRGDAKKAALRATDDYYARRYSTYDKGSK